MGKKVGKQAHMASAAEELSQKHKKQITRASTLLIDDEVDNIARALDAQVRAVRFDPDNPHLIGTDLFNLEII